LQSISPGLVRTEIIKARGASEEEFNKLFDSNPCLDPKDIADALLYALASPAHVRTGMTNV
jgi:NADP-dependent 3-hydroxy acid dehydrogenase YdfG